MFYNEYYGQDNNYYNFQEQELVLNKKERSNPKPLDNVASKGKTHEYRIYILLMLVIVFFINMVSNNVSASSGNDNLYVIKQEGKYGYIDRDGKVVIKPIYLKAKDFAEGVAPVVTPDGNWSIINRAGEVISTWKDVDEIDEFSEGLAVVRKVVKYGYIDKRQLVIPIKFDNAEAFSEGLAVVGIREGSTLIEKVHNAKYGYIDKKGNLVIDYRFLRAKNFKEGLASVQPLTENYKCGFINKTGQFVIEPIYITEGEFSEGLAPVALSSEKWGFIDKQKNFIIRPQYSWAGNFSEGVAFVLVKEKIGPSRSNVVKNGQYGYIDKSGKMIIEPRFNYVSDFRNGLARVYDRRLGYGIDKDKDISWGYIDKNGNIKWQLTK